MRHLQFTIGDGSTMDLDVTPRLEEIIRVHYRIDDVEQVTDYHIKRFVLESFAKAGE